VIAALPHDAHPMGVLLCGLSALSCAHPEQNPAMAGQNIYKSREVQVGGQGMLCRIQGENVTGVRGLEWGSGGPVTKGRCLRVACDALWFTHHKLSIINPLV
jgi:hypothetical protein